jgi:hypothetical protein
LFTFKNTHLPLLLEASHKVHLFVEPSFVFSFSPFSLFQRSEVALREKKKGAC